MVAAAHPLAAQAGADILAQGGNAFDAAVAVAAALNVVEPFMSSMAGMGFATVWVAAEQRVRVLDFVPPVPNSFPVERFQAREQLVRGPLSIGLPGNLKGWATLSASYGRLPLAAVLAPAAALADEGFPLLPFGAWEFSQNAEQIKAYPDLTPAWTENYIPAGVPKAGERLRQPALAATLRALGQQGAGLFYEGALGERLVAQVQALGGTLTMADLRGIAAVWREPAAAHYRGLAVHCPPPPCEGFQFLLALRILDGFSLGGLAPDSVEHLDLVLRAIRLAAGVRLARNNPSPAALAEIMSEAEVEALRHILRSGAAIDRPTEQWTPPEPGPDIGHTTSFSIADAEGNLVCITQSLGGTFGSFVVVPGTGVCLNNFLYWADVRPGSPNRVAPGSPLPMCMAPSISLESGRPVLALGTPGSYGILQTQVQAMVQHLDFARPLQEAVAAPRARLWDGRRVQIENRISPATIAALRERGHDITAFDTGWTMVAGGMHAIRVDPASGLMTGAADPRRDGRAVGV
jgi:gamma-glutamyltranspeptidase/glutathione hydrolase